MFLFLPTNAIAEPDASIANSIYRTDHDLYARTDCPRAYGFGAATPALRLEKGFGRESVYLGQVRRRLRMNAGKAGETYLAKALESAFLQLTFWLPTNESTVTAMARSMSCAEQ